MFFPASYYEQPSVRSPSVLLEEHRKRSISRHSYVFVMCLKKAGFHLPAEMILAIMAFLVPEPAEFARLLTFCDMPLPTDPFFTKYLTYTRYFSSLAPFGANMFSHQFTAAFHLKTFFRIMRTSNILVDANGKLICNCLAPVNVFYELFQVYIKLYGTVRLEDPSLIPFDVTMKAVHYFLFPAANQQKITQLRWSRFWKPRKTPNSFARLISIPDHDKPNYIPFLFAHTYSSELTYNHLDLLLPKQLAKKAA